MDLQKIIDWTAAVLIIGIIGLVVLMFYMFDYPPS